MPTVEDFPIVGQREYWAKVGDARRSAQQQAETQVKKGGLFQRLTGGGRHNAGAQGRTSDRPAEEPLDLPVFFRRDQGS
jgi:hypothetical protein